MQKIEALDAGLLNEFIEKIYVHEVTHEENNRNQKIDIHYKFIGLISK
ncbi:DUF4368 domain-containing protein [Acholeplasma oculi]